VNIHSNVKKDNSKFILFVGISITLVIAGLAYYNMTTSTVSVSVPIQSNGMSEIDRIKQTIREKETIRDAYSQKAMDEARLGNTVAADAAAQAVGELNQTIEKLYDDLHEANLREGDGNGETK
jgi:K+-transporting ATPase c subunit